MSVFTLALVALVATGAVAAGPKQGFDGAAVQVSAMVAVIFTAALYVLDLLVRSVT